MVKYTVIYSEVGSKHKVKESFGSMKAAVMHMEWLRRQGYEADII